MVDVSAHQHGGALSNRTGFLPVSPRCAPELPSAGRIKTTGTEAGATEEVQVPPSLPGPKNSGTVAGPLVSA